MEMKNGDLVPLGTAPNNTWELGIYRDESLVSETPESLNQINSTHPELTSYAGMKIQNSTAVPIAVVGKHRWNSFSTDIDMGQMTVGHGWLQPAFGYPLDKWTGNIMLVGQFHDFARIANLSTSFGTQVDGAYLVDSIRKLHYS